MHQMTGGAARAVCERRGAIQRFPLLPILIVARHAKWRPLNAVMPWTSGPEAQSRRLTGPFSTKPFMAFRSERPGNRLHGLCTDRSGKSRFVLIRHGLIRFIGIEQKLRRSKENRGGCGRD